MPEQIERDLYCLQMSGFVVIRDFVSREYADRLAQLARDFEAEVAAFVEAGGTAIRSHAWPLRTTRCLYAIAPEFQRLALDPRLLAWVHSYLGPPVLRDCLLQTNMPDPRNAQRTVDGDLSFHRDTTWPDGDITPMYLHALLFVDDCTRKNGATVVVPGTHRAREPGHYFKDTDRRGPQSGIDYRVYEQRYFPSAISIEASRGTLVLLDPMGIHTQGINTTESPRSVVNLTFRAKHVVGRPPLLDACAIASRHARVPVHPDLLDLLDLLESNPELPAHFGPLGNTAPR